jgi:hypothetical protein
MAGTKTLTLLGVVFFACLSRAHAGPNYEYELGQIAGEAFAAQQILAGLDDSSCTRGPIPFGRGARAQLGELLTDVKRRLKPSDQAELEEMLRKSTSHPEINEMVAMLSGLAKAFDNNKVGAPSSDFICGTSYGMALTLAMRAFQHHEAVTGMRILFRRN